MTKNETFYYNRKRFNKNNVKPSRNNMKNLIVNNPQNQFLMLDHIKMLTDNPEIIKRLAEHPDFESKYYVGRTAKYEYLKIHKKYKGKIKLVFNAIFGSDHDIIGYNYVKISIFPHFHYNHYKHNGNDLNKTNCINSLYEILDILGINESEYIDFKIINLEVGLNLYLETDVRDFIENIKLYKTTPFKENKDYEYYKISDTTSYKNIKIYAKGLQHEKNPEYKIPINTVRFEIRSNQRKYIKKVLKIYSLNDLLDEKKYSIFSEQLLKEWDNVLKLNNDKHLEGLHITPAKAKFVTNAQKIEFWKQLSQKRYINNNRKKYYNYTKDALYSHTKIKEKIKGKLQSLLL